MIFVKLKLMFSVQRTNYVLLLMCSFNNIVSANFCLSDVAYDNFVDI